MTAPMEGAPHTSMGVLFVAFTIATVVHGITTIQTVYYFRRYRQDAVIVKLGVGIVWLLESFNTTLATYTLCHYLIIQRLTPGVLTLRGPWTLPMQSTINSTLSSIIHLLFAWRIWILSNENRYLIGMIMLLSCSAWVLGTSVTILEIRRSAAPNVRGNVIIASFGLTAVADVFISGCLCFFLHIRKTASPRTNGVLNRLIFLTINNGLLSSGIALGGLITCLALPQTFVGLATCFVLGKCYFNTLLSSLNSRRSLRQKLTEDDPNARITTTMVRRHLEQLDTIEETEESHELTNAPPRFAHVP